MGTSAHGTAAILLLCSTLLFTTSCDGSDDAIQLYYGLDESERGVPACGSAAQACSVLLQRFWRPAALVRLCRCPRRRQCPITVTPAAINTLTLNNRAHFKFCEPIAHLPSCQSSYVGLSVEMSQPNYSPDEFESVHHLHIMASPPKITAYCSCGQPYYWRLHSRNVSSNIYPIMLLYKCGPLNVCKSGDFCGNVRSDVESLYQSCLCPRRHVCVHEGGLELHGVEELLYEGSARRAHCQPLYPHDNNDSDEYSDLL